MVDLVEARRDVGLEHPPVVPDGCAEVVDLRDRVLRPSSGPETIGGWLKSASKIGSSTNFNDACTIRSAVVGIPSRRELARRLWDRLLPDPVCGTNCPVFTASRRSASMSRTWPR